MPHRDRVIRFCVNNPRSLAEREGLVRAGCECHDCLSRCSACFEDRFLVVGETVFEGPDYATLLEEARRHLAAMPPLPVTP